MLEEGTQASYFKGLSRQDYIQKAHDIIQAEGVQAVSIRRIAQELHCSSACLYRYFDNLSELLYFAELRTLAGYIKSMDEAGKNWKNIWDIYVGIWDCYAREAFVHPEAYNRLFFTFTNEKLKRSIKEYYEMFPEDLCHTNQFFHEMLQKPDFMSRDFEICRRCIRAGAITMQNAIRLNRIICLLYKGYLKTVLDEGIAPEDVDERVKTFIDDVDTVVMMLAKDLKGYQGYRR